MHARVTQLRVKPGHWREFLDGMGSLMPDLRKQAGFRSFVALRTGPDPSPEVTTITVWDSVDDLKATEKNLFYTRALSRLVAYCEGFPGIREHEVVLAEFAAD